MNRLKVGVIMGGPSFEYEISVLTGQNVLGNLDKEKFEGFDILISRKGEWKPAEVLKKADVVFNALHGEFGEDGQVQKIFEKNKIPYTGSTAKASYLAMNKERAKKLFRKAGLKTPLDIKVCSKNKHFPFPPFKLPWIIKPLSRGSSVGIFLNKNRREYNSLLKKCFKYDSIALIEEYLNGREFSCGILENFRGEKYFALPPIEIIPPQQKDFFDYQAKYNGTTQEICPAQISKKISLEIQEITKKAHCVLGCRHYSRSDIILTKKGIYILEVNTLPGLTKESLLPKEAKVVGLSFKDLISHIIELAVLSSRFGNANF